DTLTIHLYCPAEIVQVRAGGELMSLGYWQKRSRVSRRNLLRAGGSMAAAVAFLAACGGDNNASPSGTTGSTGPARSTTTGSTGATRATGPTAMAPSGLLTEIVDESSKAKPGGTLRRSQNSTWATVD